MVPLLDTRLVAAEERDEARRLAREREGDRRAGREVRRRDEADPGVAHARLDRGAPVVPAGRFR